MGHEHSALPLPFNKVTATACYIRHRDACPAIFLCVLLVLAPSGGWRGNRAQLKKQSKRNTPKDRRQPRRFFFAGRPHCFDDYALERRR